MTNNYHKRNVYEDELGKLEMKQLKCFSYVENAENIVI